MLSSDLYRQFMADCLRWAKAARNEKDRATYLQLAKTWHEAALEIERGLGLISESEHLLQQPKREAPSAGREGDSNASPGMDALSETAPPSQPPSSLAENPSHREREAQHHGRPRLLDGRLKRMI